MQLNLKFSYIAVNQALQPLKTPASFDISRRKWLTAAAGMLPVAALTGLKQADFPRTVALRLPAKSEFGIQGTYLNAAYTHPMSLGSAGAVRSFLDMRMVNGLGKGADMQADRSESRALFARLINADPEELAWIPSTMVGENLVVSGLGLSEGHGRVVTDAYHFDGSLYLYQQLAKKGLDLHIIRPKNNGIDLNDLDAAITPGTKLVAISLVSTINGFQHDLKAVCKLAHARGALVYADIIQGAGAVPIDVRESGVDFCACSTYKWLMGDFGVGFLYVRKDRLDKLKRSLYGYRQLSSYAFHTFPFDAPGSEPFESLFAESAA
jgi:selenocysteine lyase/cysteine desulfurase